MKFHKMIKKLQQGPNRTASSRSANMFQQDIVTLQFWFCEEYSDVARVANFQKAIAATDWEISEEGR